MPAAIPCIEMLTDAVVAAFVCILGANVGSFLNVVAHRAPRGLSVVVGGSRCPACGRSIRWFDNVPIVGWILLRGRCRDCGASIAARYPLVEATGALSGAIVAVELLSSGRTWPPGRFGTGRIGADVLLTHFDWPLLAVCTIHGALLLVLLGWVLAEIDRFAIGWRWAGAAATVLAAAVISAGGPTWIAGWPAVETTALGLGAAAGLGLGVSNRWLRQALVMCGVVLGWQALVTTVAMMPIVAAVRVACGRSPGGQFPIGPTCTDLLASVGVQFLAWRWLAGVWM